MAMKSQRKAKQERRLRFRMRDVAQRLSSAAGVRRCGVASHLCGSGSIRAGVPMLHVCNAGSGRTWFSGLLRCASVWECPVCAPRIQAGRAQELKALNAAHVAAGGGLYMATLTLPHKVGDDLAPMRKHLAKAWSRCIAGAPWKRWEARLGVKGLVRSSETTHGPNGWHSHFHVALYTAAPLDAGECQEFSDWLYDRWTFYITKPTANGKLYNAPSRRHGVRLTPLREADYLAKMGLASELARQTTKDGRKGHRTPWQILRDIVQNLTDNATRRRDIELWKEWAAGIRGARQLTWSRNCRRLAESYAVAMTEDDGALPDAADDAERNLFDTESSEVVHAFTAEEWKAIHFSPRSVAARIRLLELPSKVPRWEWLAGVVEILDWARGLEPVPF